MRRRQAQSEKRRLVHTRSRRNASSHGTRNGNGAGTCYGNRNGNCWTATADGNRAGIWNWPLLTAEAFPRLSAVAVAGPVAVAVAGPVTGPVAVSSNAPGSPRFSVPHQPSKCQHEATLAEREGFTTRFARCSVPRAPSTSVETSTSLKFPLRFEPGVRMVESVNVVE